MSCNSKEKRDFKLLPEAAYEAVKKTAEQRKHENRKGCSKEKMWH